MTDSPQDRRYRPEDRIMQGVIPYLSLAGQAVTAGCTVAVDYGRQPWGDDWGMVKDPFGILWAVLTPDPALWDRKD